MKTENQTTLQTYLEKGVTQISVQDGEARAVNPYEKWRYSSGIRIINRDWLTIANLPSIPCPSIPNGVYEIERFKEQKQWISKRSDGIWTDYPVIHSHINLLESKPELFNTRTVLVLKDQPEETVCPICKHSNHTNSCPENDGYKFLKEHVALGERFSRRLTEQISEPLAKTNRNDLEISDRDRPDENEIVSIECLKRRGVTTLIINDENVGIEYFTYQGIEKESTVYTELLDWAITNEWKAIGIPEGEYAIGSLTLIKQYKTLSGKWLPIPKNSVFDFQSENKVTQRGVSYEVRTVLVLKDQPEELHGCEMGEHDYIPDMGMDNSYSNYSCRECGHVEGSEEKPEGETIERSAGETLNNHLEDSNIFDYEYNRILSAMQEHAQNRLNQYQAGLIAKLENSLKNKDAHHMIYRADGIEEAIDLIKNN